MLLRTSISNTKKFFRRTLETFKSLLSDGYQRIPKSPPSNPFSRSTGGSVDINISQSYRELDLFYQDFTTRWDHENEKLKKRSKKKKTSTTRAKHEDDRICAEDLMKFSKVTPTNAPAKTYQVEEREDQKKKRLVYEGRRKQEYLPNSLGEIRKERNCLVTEKLKELEIVDKGNVEHVLDIEEVIHYYSLLTCPAYLDIVDKFFMDIYTEAISLKTQSEGNNTIQTQFCDE
ncbi:unnamed protein product [Ilex paraguariensis]|uniref:OVATE domain-containing protein n=1 Tax=Ilex paraguariensis TaxID=185542 RepID=A0ABC8TTP2_9AQUA